MKHTNACMSYVQSLLKKVAIQYGMVCEVRYVGLHMLECTTFTIHRNLAKRNDTAQNSEY